MSTEAEEEKTPQEILNTVFDLVPTLESVYNRHGEQSLQEMFDEVLAYRTDESIFPGFARFRLLTAAAAAKIHGSQAGRAVYDQLGQSSVMHTQVHLSMLRSFDGGKRLDESGRAKPDAHYNTLVLQSEILWAAVNRRRGQHSLAANSGMITLSNETSPAYIQYGAKAAESVRLCNNENYHNGLAYAYALSKEQLLKARQQIAAIADRRQKQRALQTLETLAAADNFAEGVCRVYGQQLQELYDAPMPAPYNIEATEVLNQVMIENLKDSDSLTHYIFAHPEVCKYYHDCFAGIAMGWKAKDACDENGQPNGIAAYDAFWELKKLKNNGSASKKMTPCYKALMFDKQNGAVKTLPVQEMIDKIEQKELAPKYLTHVAFCFLESGTLTVGGLAQAPYNTAVKKRSTEFIDGLCAKVRSGVFPPLPKKLSPENLMLRKKAIAAMPTEIPVAGLGILRSKDGVNLANYAEFLDGNLQIDENTLQKIGRTKVKDAIMAAAPTIFEYKLGAGDYHKLVGDKALCFPQTILSRASKQNAALALRGKIAAATRPAVGKLPDLTGRTIAAGAHEPAAR